MDERGLLEYREEYTKIIGARFPALFNLEAFHQFEQVVQHCNQCLQDDSVKISSGDNEFRDGLRGIFTNDNSKWLLKDEGTCKYAK